MARGRNADQEYNADESRLNKIGRGPLLLEPVRATITTAGSHPFSVEKLDHDGLPTGETIAVRGRSFEIDGARDRTPYYLLKWTR